MDDASARSGTVLPLRGAQSEMSGAGAGAALVLHWCRTCVCYTVTLPVVLADGSYTDRSLEIEVPLGKYGRWLVGGAISRRGGCIVCLMVRAFDDGISDASKIVECFPLSLGMFTRSLKTTLLGEWKGRHSIRRNPRSIVGYRL